MTTPFSFLSMLRRRSQTHPRWRNAIIIAICSAIVSPHSYVKVANALNTSLLQMTTSENTSGWNSSLIPLIFIGSDFFLEFCSNSLPVKTLESRLHSILLYYGVPSASLPTAEEIVLSVCATIVTLLAYFFLFGKRHVKRRKRLAEDLKLAQLKVCI